MAAYQPTSRRPLARAFRETAERSVRFCVRRGIHPDLISYASIVASAGAGLCFWQAGRVPTLLLLASMLCVLRLWLNMLDGMVALASGKASRRGELVNELPDRFSDVLIFVGVAHSGLCHIVSGYWAAIFALLTAYVGTLGQALGAERQFGGVMAKPWRMVVLVLGACLALAMHVAGNDEWRLGGLTVLDWTCVLVVLGCVQTMWVRLARIVRRLDGNDTSRPVD